MIQRKRVGLGRWWRGREVGEVEAVGSGIGRDLRGYQARTAGAAVAEGEDADWRYNTAGARFAQPRGRVGGRGGREGQRESRRRRRGQHARRLFARLRLFCYTLFSSAPLSEAPMDSFHYRNGRLFCEDVPVAHLAAAVGTPVYIYSRATLTGHYQRLAAAFAPLHPLICYSVKSCGNIHLCRILRELGSGMDVTSGGELFAPCRPGPIRRTSSSPASGRPTARSTRP